MSLASHGSSRPSSTLISGRVSRARSSLASRASQASKGRAPLKHTVADNTQLLKQYSVDRKSVKLSARVAAGAFGEVFVGTCLGQPVAIKTLKRVTPASASALRAEVLLTAALRHPNVVGFVGACWEPELTCLILEWLPRGSLGDLLKAAPGAAVLRWEEPLLRLATDVARGMAYLHAREFFDETTGERCCCIAHRDLKPDNVLITDYGGAKVSDFGESRSLNDARGLAGIVGTPVFAAPEVMREEAQTELIDVYSFGMFLASFAAATQETSVVAFIWERWAQSLAGKDAAPAGPISTAGFRHALVSIARTGWRPFSQEHRLPGSPTAVNALAVRCCSPDPAARPTFAEIVASLEGPCAEGVKKGWEEEEELAACLQVDDNFVGRASEFGSAPPRLSQGAATTSAANAVDSQGPSALAARFSVFAHTQSRASSAATAEPHRGSAPANAAANAPALIVAAADSPFPAGDSGGNDAKGAEDDDVTEHKDAEGKTYFYSKSTGKTGWAREDVTEKADATAAAAAAADESILRERAGSTFVI